MIKEILEIILEIWIEIKFLVFSFWKNIESSAELKTSFFINIIGMAINNSSFLLLWYFFGKISGNLGGWEAIDVFGLLGFSTIGYGICFTFFSGISDLPEIVRSGDFDKFLLSPKNVLLRLSSSTISVSAIGDILFGVICLSVWIFNIGFSFKILVIIFLLSICSGVIHFAFSVFANSVSFYFYESRNIVQGLFQLFIGPSLFYGGAIQGILRAIFIFIVPALLTGVYPVEVVRSGSGLKVFFIAIMTILWVALSVFVWNKSVKKYESSNFINFG